MFFCEFKGETNPDVVGGLVKIGGTEERKYESKKKYCVSFVKKIPVEPKSTRPSIAEVDVAGFI